MFEDLLRKFPDMVQALLNRAAQTEGGVESPVVKEARAKLISQLKIITEEMSQLSKQKGESLTEEQMKQILEIPRNSPDHLGWAFLQGQRKK